ncbi:MAG: response regulator transcription factor [Ruminococcus sp.]|nr:response regulator transcription factor [Ruminococcus sp.]
MIYFLEDDPSIRNFVLYALNSCGFEAKGFEVPSEFYAAIEKELPEVLLLDIMLPEEDGLSILKKLRASERTKKLPIIMLTAMGTEYDKVNGLDCGADDYITKPFGTLELVSRIKALLRRTTDLQPVGEEIITLGGLSIYPARHEVYTNGTLTVLTNKEYETLLLLVKNKNIVFSRDTLLKEIWGFDFKGESRTVDVHIRTLRAKLRECGELIRTIRGVGYKAGETEIE